MVALHENERFRRQKAVELSVKSGRMAELAEKIAEVEPYMNPVFEADILGDLCTAADNAIAALEGLLNESR